MAETIFPQSPAASSDARDKATEPHFQPFELYRDEVDQAQLSGSMLRNLAQKVSSIATGVGTIMELTLDDNNRAQNLDVDNPCADDRPLLSVPHMWYLQRLAVEALRLMDDECERVMKFAFEHHTPKGRAEKKAFDEWLAKQKP